ncbi:ribonuclease HII [Clostridium malenominatum]
MDFYIKNYDNNKKEELLNICNFIKNDPRKNVQSLYNKALKTIEKFEKELERIFKMYSFDRGFSPLNYLAGVDEVGRGPLAGPIVGASVVLNLNNLEYENLILEVNDSKKLTANKRKELDKIIKEKALYYKIVAIDNNTIDTKGIAWCNNEVLKNSALNLEVTPDIILSDGYGIKGLNIKNEFVIKGDSKSISIACASIIAKVYRDNIMEEYAKIYPHYGFEHNAGYGTAEHIEGLKKFGPSPIHRFSFIKNII